MKPIDYRNATFDSLRDSLDKRRRAVYEAWQQHGPGTARAVAARAGMDILSFRPRSTELYQVGLLTVVDDGERVERRNGREGTYVATPAAVWDLWRDLQVSGQQPLL